MIPEDSDSVYDLVLDTWLTPPVRTVDMDATLGGRLPVPRSQRAILPGAPLASLPPKDTHRAWGGGAETVVHCWDGPGPVVALMHGWGGSALTWGLWIGHLVRAGCKVVAVDAPAHGFAEGDRASAPAFAGSLRAASRMHGPFDAMVTHSLGAIAGTLAVADGEPVAALVHLAACVDVDQTLVHAARTNLLPERDYAGLRRRLAQRFGEDISLDTAMARVANPPPTLFLHDPDDPEMPFEAAVAASERWPGSRCVPVTGVGHERIALSRSGLQIGIGFLAQHLPLVLPPPANPYPQI